MLAGDIVRASAWLCPSFKDYRTTPEFTTAVRVSKSLIEDVIASVPYFLGDGRPETRGENVQGGRGSIIGTTALGLFITWPLMVLNMSDYSTDRQRRWAVGRLRYVADLGIGQAHLFSNVCFLIPPEKKKKTNLAN